MLDSSLSTDLIIGGGVCGVVVVLMILKVLVPGWYATKLEAENKVLADTAKRAVNELAVANQVISELRVIAIVRGGPEVAERLAAPRQGGAALEAPVVAQET